MSADLHLVMFDIDGTLVDSNSVEDRCFVRACRDVTGVDEIDDDWSTYRNVTDEGCASEIIERAFGRSARDNEIAAIRERHIALLQEEADRDPSQLWAMPGAVDLFAALKARDDTALAIATGAWSGSAAIKLRTSGIPCEGVPLVSSDVSIRRIEIMRAAEERALEHYRVDRFASRTYVGDGVWDATGSRELGYRFVGVARGERAERLRREGARRVFDDFTDRDAVIGELLSSAE